jgi:hypothetical protein
VVAFILKKGKKDFFVRTSMKQDGSFSACCRCYSYLVGEMLMVMPSISIFKR